MDSGGAAAPVTLPAWARSRDSSRLRQAGPASSGDGVNRPPAVETHPAVGREPGHLLGAPRQGSGPAVADTAGPPVWGNLASVSLPSVTCALRATCSPSSRPSLPRGYQNSPLQTPPAPLLSGGLASPPGFCFHATPLSAALGHPELRAELPQGESSQPHSLATPSLLREHAFPVCTCARLTHTHRHAHAPPRLQPACQTRRFAESQLLSADSAPLLGTRPLEDGPRHLACSRPLSCTHRAPRDFPWSPGSPQSSCFFPDPSALLRTAVWHLLPEVSRGWGRALPGAFWAGVLHRWVGTCSPQPPEDSLQLEPPGEQVTGRQEGHRPTRTGHPG